jgi:hypothetical protein
MGDGLRRVGGLGRVCLLDGVGEHGDDRDPLLRVKVCASTSRCVRQDRLACAAPREAARASETGPGGVAAAAFLLPGTVNLLVHGATCSPHASMSLAIPRVGP